MFFYYSRFSFSVCWLCVHAAHLSRLARRQEKQRSNPKSNKTCDETMKTKGIRLRYCVIYNRRMADGDELRQWRRRRAFDYTLSMFAYVYFQLESNSSVSRSLALHMALRTHREQSNKRIEQTPLHSCAATAADVFIVGTSARLHVSAAFCVCLYFFISFFSSFASCRASKNLRQCVDSLFASFFHVFYPVRFVNRIQRSREKGKQKEKRNKKWKKIEEVKNKRTKVHVLHHLWSWQFCTTIKISFVPFQFCLPFGLHRCTFSFMLRSAFAWMYACIERAI